MNMQALMRQAQNIQKEMLKSKDEIDKMEFVGTSSLVTVKMNGKKEVVDVKIDYQDLEKEDFPVLQDMILVAFNNALSQVDKITEEKMGKYTKQMPGLF